jgi:hypothetical protein
LIRRSSTERRIKGSARPHLAQIDGFGGASPALGTLDVPRLGVASSRQRCPQEQTISYSWVRSAIGFGVLPVAVI